MDIFVAGLSLLLISPLLAAIALLVRVSMGSPVLFRQERAGRDGRPFTILKFRTMREGPGEDADRLTRVGRALRATSLDELPELVNVLRGDMSVVGPRPLLMEYLERYSADQARRHEVRPGVTGLAQVSGRNQQSWAERLELDVWYVDHWSLRLDLVILARTVRSVLLGHGISADGHATKEKFLGTQQVREEDTAPSD